jgi:hypothetical protein
LRDEFAARLSGLYSSPETNDVIIDVLTDFLVDILDALTPSHPEKAEWFQIETPSMQAVPSC